MPIPHFNTSEFFIDEPNDNYDDDDNDAILDNNDDDESQTEGPINNEDNNLQIEEYTNLIIQFSNIIERKYDEWKFIVNNYYRNDDIMDDLIEEVQSFQNLLSRIFDIVENDRFINTDDKDELLTSIAELNGRCEEALEGE